MEIKIEGLEETIKALDELPALVVFGTFGKALDRAGGVIQAEVESRAPDGENGLLKEAGVAVVRVDAQGRGGSVNVGYSHFVRSEEGVPADLIASWVEYGHRQVSHKPGHKEVGHVPAHPFMRPAAEAAADKAIEVFRAVVLEGLESGTL
jgi:HK97 gp10 family phage protein